MPLAKIFYASLTGNTEEIADIVAESLEVRIPKEVRETVKCLHAGMVWIGHVAPQPLQGGWRDKFTTSVLQEE